MATRALIGYLKNGILTTTYNHYDGYPEHLGKALNTFYKSDSEAEQIANKGYISFIDDKTGEIEANNKGRADKINLNQLDPEQAAEEVAGLIDSYGADYAYFYGTEGWEHIQNNSIRSMIDPLQDILFGDFDNTYDKEEMEEAYHVGDNKEVVTKESSEINEDLIAKAEKILKGKANLDDYLKSLQNDIRLNGEEGYVDYTVEDFVEDYNNYIQDKMDIDESFIRQMKYKAGIIK